MGWIGFEGNWVVSFPPFIFIDSVLEVGLI
jgi:hypothetical protein